MTKYLSKKRRSFYYQPEHQIFFQTLHISRQSNESDCNDSLQVEAHLFWIYTNYEQRLDHRTRLECVCLDTFSGPISAGVRYSFLDIVSCTRVLMPNMFIDRDQVVVNAAYAWHVLLQSVFRPPFSTKVISKNSYCDITYLQWLIAVHRLADEALKPHLAVFPHLTLQAMSLLQLWVSEIGM